MKADQVRAKEAMKNSTLPVCGQKPEQFIGRKRNVKEKANRCIGQLFTQQLWQQHELIVMNPDGITGLIDVYNFFSEKLVDATIRVEVFFLKTNQRWKIMKQRPNRGVGKTIVKIIVNGF